VTTIPTTQAPLAMVATANALWVTIPEANSVIRVDPSTNKIVASIQTGKSPMGITAGEGAIWVTNGRDKSVSRIDPQVNAVTATIRVGTYPDSIVVGDGAVWVANAEGCWGCVGTISRIDPAKNAVVKTIKTWKYGTEVSPSDLLFQDGILWAIAAEHVLRIDPEKNKIVKWILIPSKKIFGMPEGLGKVRIHGLAIVDHWLLLADPSERSLWKVDIDTNEAAHEPMAVGFPLSILGQDKDGSLWISDMGEGSILRVKP
jgi:YVTN family beta-propeller protein